MDIQNGMSSATGTPWWCRRRCPRTGPGQIDLAAVAADGVPAHAVREKNEELYHGGHGKGGIGKMG